MGGGKAHPARKIELLLASCFGQEMLFAIGAIVGSFDNVTEAQQLPPS